MSANFIDSGATIHKLSRMSFVSNRKWCIIITNMVGDIIMIGSVYCVLFSDGTLKAGVTFGEPSKRIRQHFQAARSFGLKPVVALFTEAHHGASGTEAMVLEFLSGRLSKRSAEHFSGATIDDARQAMIKTGLLVAWTREARSTGGHVLVPASVEPKEWCQVIPSSISKKIIDALEKGAEKGVTKGVLKNRFRNQFIDHELDALVASGDIVVSKSIHPKKKVEIIRYFRAGAAPPTRDIIPSMTQPAR